MTSDLLRFTAAVVPVWANSMEDFLTAEVVSVSDDHVSGLQRRHAGLSQDGQLQVLTRRLQDGRRHGALAQVHVLCHRVHDAVRLQTEIRTALTAEQLPPTQSLQHQTEIKSVKTAENWFEQESNQQPSAQL